MATDQGGQRPAGWLPPPPPPPGVPTTPPPPAAWPQPGAPTPKGPPQRPAGPPPPPTGPGPGGPPAPPPPGGHVGAPAVRAPGSNRRWLVLIVGLIVAAAIAGGLVFALGRDDEDDPVATGPATTSADQAPTPAATVSGMTIPLPSVGLLPTTPSVPSAPLPAGEPPGDLGDDAELDALADACFDGDMRQCDILFLRSDFDSDYKTYGDTCAGRQPATTGRLCADVFGTAVPATTIG